MAIPYLLKHLLGLLIIGALNTPVYSSLSQPKYGFFVKRESNTTLTKFTIFSERCSGSNYTKHLLLKNLEIENDPFCHKHFPPWFELPASEYHGNPAHYTFDGTNDHLFVIIFRNPYDWTRSLIRKPWHTHSSLQGIPFEMFIRTTWETDNEAETNLLREFNPLLDKDPKTKGNFDNCLKLRSAKIKNMLMIQQKVKNCYHVNYETLRDFPEEVLTELAILFDLSRNPEFQPILFIKGKPDAGPYVPRVYPHIDESLLSFINSQLDWELENLVGYQMIYDPSVFSKK